MNTVNTPNERPHCQQCQHFGVSWEPRMPYLCRLFGFKSRQLPCLEVLRNDGCLCRGFLKKTMSQPAQQAAPVTSQPATPSGIERWV